MRIFLSLCMITLFALNVQGQLNDYKYIVVPKRFNGFKNENQHQTSTLIKHLFATKGFNTVYEDALPDELRIDRCMGLTVDLDEKSSMFTTKTILILKDCNGEAKFITQEGRSREKDFKISYSEAIRQAFQSIEGLEYAYTGNSNGETVTLDFKNDIKSLDDDKSDAKKEDAASNRNVNVRQVATQEEQSFESKEPTPSNYKKGVQQEQTNIQQTATVDNQSYEDKTPVESGVQKGADSAKELTGALYAQELENGYQLVDSSPKIVMIINKTSLNDIYSAKSDHYHGIVFRRDGKWLFEYVADSEIIQKQLDIKF